MTVRSRRTRNSPGYCPENICVAVREVVVELRLAQDLVDFAGGGLLGALSALSGKQHSDVVAERGKSDAHRGGIRVRWRSSRLFRNLRSQATTAGP